MVCLLTLIFVAIRPKEDYNAVKAHVPIVELNHGSAATTTVVDNT